LRFLKNSEDITFLGALSENDRKEFLSNEDILAYPSRMDGTARPIREALLQGKDMLLSDGTGLGSWLNNQISSSIFWVNNKYRNSYLIAFYMIETTNQDGREVLSVKNQRELIKIAMSYA
jgi:glycosyltransferase involved in cell wall biosynthesis